MEMSDMIFFSTSPMVEISKMGNTIIISLMLSGNKKMFNLLELIGALSVMVRIINGETGRRTQSHGPYY